MNAFNRSMQSEGFALPLAMVALSILAVLAFGMQVFSLEGSQGIAQLEAALRRRWLFDAAIARVLTALETPGDPIREALFSEHDLRWEFDGTTVTLRLETESRKLDINAADRALVRQVVGALLGDRYQDAVRPSVLDVNAVPTFNSPVELLEPPRRFGAEAETLKRHLTALSGQLGTILDFSAAQEGADPHDPDSGQGSLAPPLAGSIQGPIRSIYRIIVQDDGRGSASSQVAQADMYIALNENDPARFAIIHSE